MKTAENMHSKTVLNNGVEMECFGLGLYRAEPGDDAYNAARYALDYGYRLIDTAEFYKNEGDVGRAVADSGVQRENVFITSKIWPTDFHDPASAFENCLKYIRSDYIDMYLLHWPGVDVDARYKTWEYILGQMEKGRIRACGVSNFCEDHLRDLIDQFGVVPASNQIELHPWYQRRDMRAYCAQNGISVTAWGPIFHGRLGDEPLVAELGKEIGRSAAQVTLRWHLQHGINIIPKSSKKERIESNAQIFDFSLSDEDMAKIDALDGKGSVNNLDPYTFDGNL
jgi:diketogulonate reductase-like aldo/keto reductase